MILKTVLILLTALGSIGSLHNVATETTPQRRVIACVFLGLYIYALIGVLTL